MKLFFASVLGICLSLSAFAQYDDSLFYRPVLTFKFDMVQLMNPNDPAALFYVEGFYHREISSNLYGGPIVNIENGYDNQLGDGSFKGFKIGHELRIFIPGMGEEGRIYGGFNTQYRFLSIYDRYTLGMNCVSGDCDYLTNFVGDIKTDRFSYEFKLGYQTGLFDRLLFEFDYGLGYHDLRLRRGSVNGGSLIDYSRYLNENSFGHKTFATFSMKIGYMIIQRKERSRINF